MQKKVSLKLGFDFVEAKLTQDFEDVNYKHLFSVLGQLKHNYTNAYTVYRYDNLKAVELSAVAHAFYIYREYLLVRYKTKLKELNPEEIEEIEKILSRGREGDYSTFTDDVIESFLEEQKYIDRLQTFAQLSDFFKPTERQVLYLVFSFYADFCKPAERVLQLKKEGKIIRFDRIDPHLILT